MHERDSEVPCRVPALPNPTICKGWPHSQGLRALLFSNNGAGSFTSHKNRGVWKSGNLESGIGTGIGTGTGTGTGTGIGTGMGRKT